MAKYVCSICGFVYDEERSAGRRYRTRRKVGRTHRMIGFARFVVEKSEFEKES